MKVVNDTGLQYFLNKLKIFFVKKSDIWHGTQAEYDALSIYDDNVIYLIREE